MARCKKANSGKRPPAERLTDAERYAMREAKRLGLFVLFEQDRDHRSWRLYDAGTGKLVGWYTPFNHRYGVLGREGVNPDGLAVLRLAAGRDG